MTAYKDISFPLRKAYQTALDGNLSLGGDNVPVYDRVPADASAPYVYYSGFTDDDTDTNKDRYVHNVTMTLTVVTRFIGEEGGKKDSDDIAGQIMAIIMPTQRQEALDLSSDGFKMLYSKMDNSGTFSKDSKAGILFFRTLRFRHQIHQTS